MLFIALSLYFSTHTHSLEGFHCVCALTHWHHVFRIIAMLINEAVANQTVSWWIKISRYFYQFWKVTSSAAPNHDRASTVLHRELQTLSRALSWPPPYILKIIQTKTLRLDLSLWLTDTISVQASGARSAEGPVTLLRSRVRSLLDVFLFLVLIICCFLCF